MHYKATPGKELSKEEIKKLIKDYNVELIKLQFSDINGNVKHLAVPVSQIDKVLNNEYMLDGSSIKGFRNIETSDMYFYPDRKTFAILPWREMNGKNVARIICDVHDADGSPSEVCPRCNLKRLIKEAEKIGYEMNVGPELEFFLFEKDEDGFLTLNTNDLAGYYDIGPNDKGEEVRREMIEALEAMGLEIEASHHEVARGQHEIDFKYSDALTTADNVVTFKAVVQAIADKHNLHATFMAKPIFGINGSGMHCNISLFKDGKNAFCDPDKEFGLSDEAYYSIGAMLKEVCAFTAITNPTVNSYKRLVPGYEAPVYLAWSCSNRSALIRIPAKRGSSTRLELRSPDPSCNPYLVFAIMMTVSLEGIENKIKPPKQIEDNIYEMSDKERKAAGIMSLPGSLNEALYALKKNEMAKKALGEHIFNEFVSSKEKEWDQYRINVSQWEIERYL